MLQRVAVCEGGNIRGGDTSALQYGVVCCSVLQCMQCVCDLCEQQPGFENSVFFE